MRLRQSFFVINHASPNVMMNIMKKNNKAMIINSMELLLLKNKYLFIEKSLIWRCLCPVP